MGQRPSPFFLAWAGLGRAQPSPTRNFLGRAQPTPTPTSEARAGAGKRGEASRTEGLSAAVLLDQGKLRNLQVAGYSSIIQFPSSAACAGITAEVSEFP